MKTLALISALCLALPLSASDPSHPDATVQFDYANPDLSPSAWSLIIHPNGSGHFKSEPGPSTSKGMDVPGIDQPIQLTPAFAQYVLDVAASRTVLSGNCESHLKVAFQGWKTITYKDGNLQGTCRFNYTKDRSLEKLSSTLLAVATTLVEGQRLEMLLQHDPLGLDSEMGFLVDSARDGRVKQIGSIQGILKRLEQDQTVMERVRKRAQILLANAAVEK